MSTSALPSPPPQTADDSKTALRAALHSLLQMGLRVAEASTRLAEVEREAADLLSQGVAEGSQAVKPQETAEAAWKVGHLADVSEAARDLSACRMALITTTFERASRAVRRTAALIDRVERPQVWRMPPAEGPGSSGPGEARAPREAEDLYERPDAPEIDDETHGRPPNQVLADIHRDLRAATMVENARPVAPAADIAVPDQAVRKRSRPRPANDVQPDAGWEAVIAGLPDG